MRERNKDFSQERRLLDASETCSYLNLGIKVSNLLNQ